MINKTHYINFGTILKFIRFIKHFEPTRTMKKTKNPPLAE